MFSELTAVFQPTGKGRIRARVAELPNISAEGATIKEARANLTQAVRKALEEKRGQTLAKASASAQVERIRVRLKGPPREGKKAGQARRRRPSREYELLQALLEEGLIDEIPDLGSLDTDKMEPIRVEGKPISEEIIEARR